MTDLPRPSQLGPDATIEDLVRSARAHGIELPYRVSLPEDTENDPQMRPVTYRRRDGEMVLPQRGGEKRPQFELIEGDHDGTAWRVVYRRVPDPFRDIYQEIHRERLPEPDPTVAEPLIAELDRIHREWGSPTTGCPNSPAGACAALPTSRPTLRVQLGDSAIKSEGAGPR